MTKSQALKESFKNKLIRFRRKYIPYLVFYDQEIDVLVTWKENKLSQNADVNAALKQLNQGHLAQIENMMSEIGITFDKGIGFEGRDWEWDFSLTGPVNVKFRKPCVTEEKRS